MEVPPSKPGLTLGAMRELLLPVTLLACFAIYYLGEQPFWVVLVCAIPALILYALAPSWALRSMAQFDRDAVGILAAGRPDALQQRYAQALGMRLFAPPAMRAERKAMVLAETGEMRGARAAYLEALEEHTNRPPLRVMLGYAHACFALEDDGQAISMYRRLLSSAGVLPGVERNLAHALVRRGEDLEDAIAMLERAERETLDAAHRARLKLLRALAHAKRGEPERAREIVDESGTNDDGHEQTAALRGELRALLDR